MRYTFSLFLLLHLQGKGIGYIRNTWSLWLSVFSYCFIHRDTIAELSVLWSHEYLSVFSYCFKERFNIDITVGDVRHIDFQSFLIASFRESSSTSSPSTYTFTLFQSFLIASLVSRDILKHIPKELKEIFQSFLIASRLIDINPSGYPIQFTFLSVFSYCFTWYKTCGD